MLVRRQARAGVPVLFVAWLSRSGRAEEIAAELGGDSLCVRPRLLDRSWLTPVRWLASAVLTVAGVVTRKPAVVIVQNPPVWAALAAFLAARAVGSGVVLDSHPGGFGAMNDRVGARVQRMHAWLARRATAVLVTTQDWVDLVEQWGGRGLVVHEAPGDLCEASLPARSHPPVVLAVSTFDRDEPVGLLIDAARLVPDVRVEITGNVSRADPALVASAPPNVRFVGYLDKQRYEAAIVGSDAVLVVTDEPTSVPRSACEAVWAQRPLIVSDTSATAEFFPFAIRVPGTIEGVADGLRRLLDEPDALVASVRSAAADQRERWEQQLADLRAVVVEAAVAGAASAA